MSETWSSDCDEHLQEIVPFKASSVNVIAPSSATAVRRQSFESSFSSNSSVGPLPHDGTAPMVQPFQPQQVAPMPGQHVAPRQCHSPYAQVACARPQFQPAPQLPAAAHIQPVCANAPPQTSAQYPFVQPYVVLSQTQLQQQQQQQHQQQQQQHQQQQQQNLMHQAFQQQQQQQQQQQRTRTRGANTPAKHSNIPAKVAPVAKPAASQDATPTFSSRKSRDREATIVATPWFPDGVIKESVTLAAEVAALGQLMHLTPKENAVRNSLRSVLQEHVTTQWPDATVKVYGGFAYETSLPDSGLDLVVDDCANLSSFQDAVRNITTLANLQVEYVYNCETEGEQQGFAKLKDVSAGIVANITFFEGKSPARATVQSVQSRFKAFPAAKEVYTAARMVLKQSGLTDPATGGLSSYAVLMLVFHVCQHTENAADPGQLLVDFFSLYASPFDNVLSPDQRNTTPKVCPAGATPPQIWLNDIGGDSASNVAGECTKAGEINAVCKACASTLAKWSAGKLRSGYRGRSPLSSILAYETLWDRAEDSLQ